MNGIVARKLTELNNNSEMKKAPDFSLDRNYASSASSSDISEDVEISSVQDESSKQDNPVESEPDIRRFRSMSDGAPITRTGEGDDAFEVFPSLPDSVLEKMGLLGDNPRERLTDEEVEQKFISLSLAFTIDAATIKDRCERQRRYRDQTDRNLHVEIERLIEKVNRLQPLCIDAETTELLTGLLGQVDIIIRASAHAATSAERFGAVQHEERLAESVQLMINHVNILKTQRDSAKRHLQYTKRVLQDTNSSDTSAKLKTTQMNGRMITRRRASIATISQPHQENSNRAHHHDPKRMTRRTSELSLRGSILARTARPSRLELGVDLVKIREGTVESIVMPSVLDEENDDFADDTTSCQSNEESMDSCESKVNSRKPSQVEEIDPQTLPIRNRFIYRVKRIGKLAENTIKEWLNSGSTNEVFCFCALMCFSLSIITMGNILIEFECAKRGASLPFFCWNFSNYWADGTNANIAEYSRIHSDIET